MQTRKLGNTDLMVGPLCFGGNVFGWTIDEEKSFEILNAFTDAGFNFIDTADVYSRWKSGIGGESETIIGKWMKQKGNRDKIILATKVGMDMGQGKTDVTKKYILKAVEDSLRRLQTDHIDLYQTHKDDLDTPVEEALEAYAQLIKEGKVRYAGCTSFNASRLNSALQTSKKLDLPLYTCFQPLYNLYDREEFEKKLEPICVENNLGVITYFSLCAGFLSGKYRSEADLSKSVRGARVKVYLNKRGYAILKGLDELSNKYKVPQSSIALAWLIARPSVTAPIASATSMEQLNALIKGTHVNLTSEDIKLLNGISSYD